MSWLLALGLAAQAAEVSMADPNQWLEDVTGEKPLAWVREHNAKTEAEISASPGFDVLNTRLRGILDSDERIPYASKIGSSYYNLWQDKEHEKGLWRRTTLEEYRKGSPTWETVLDLDALSKAEGESWVWHGSSCLEPAYTRCLLQLSRGGADADVVREFDLTTKDFVKDGFTVPEAKSDVSWVDQDTLFVGTDWGAGTMTSSGYPRQVKEWKRGTPLADAKLVFEGQDSDVSVGASKDHTVGFEREWVFRGITFYSGEYYLRQNGALVKLDVPIDAQVSSHREWLMVELRTDWTVGGKTWPSGSLVVAKMDGFLAGERSFEALFTPTERSALASAVPTRNTIVVNEMDNVRNRVYVWRNTDGKWSRTPITGLPDFGAVGVSAVDDGESDLVWLTTTDFLTPTTLSLLDVADGKQEKLKSLPAFFDASGLEISQHEATSEDGTKIPYFLVSKQGIKLNKKTPTLLYGYGGFEVSMTPGYNAAMGAAWLEEGGAYALANIRGGGEFGPRWHQAALKENRHKAYEDFAAVARDLIARKVTSPKHLGAMGGSNGGLLMGNMLTQYPELFGAIVCQVPLLDMRRYHTLLAGASWMGEYGDPDVEAEWKFIQTFSPYHLADPKAKYPRTLFTTSTRDDRVHPGHARKMVAKLEEQGHDVLYWENIEGGHGGAANNAQRAYMWALSWTFLRNELM